MASKQSQNLPDKPKPSPNTRGLGRGLSTLLGDSGIAAASSSHISSANATVFQNVPVEWINVGPWQPRQQFDRGKLDELAISIRQKGIVQPVLLRPKPDRSNRFQLVAGERRWRAAQMAGVHEIPSVVRDLSDSECYEIALVENIQRQDLSVIDEAQGYEKLLKINEYTQDQLAKIIGKSRSYITNLLRLLGLPPTVQKLLSNGEISIGQARPLVGHPQAESLAKKIVEKSLSSRQVEALIKMSGEVTKSEVRTSVKAEKSADIKELERRAAIELGMILNIDWNKKTENGQVRIDCKSLDQMTDVLNKLGLSN